jgi:DNA-directed RNA polymerase specialized sigma24 family protein
MQSFLLWLGEDESSGARTYEEIRRKLILLFRWRGCYIPEELADETIDRVERAVLKPDFHYDEGDKALYFRGFARNVFREWLRKERRLPTDPITETHIELPAPSTNPEPDDLRRAYLEHCLNKLPSESKSLVLRYYRGDKREKIDGRQLQAKELGIELNALRIQAYRLRNELRRCVEDCEAKGEIQCTKEA